MRVLLIGGGGREHALAWRLVRDGADVIAAPGSDAIAELARTAAIDPAGTGELIELARRERVELAVVGPEQPLVDGLADALRAAGIPTFGPSAAAARLEGSKADAKAFMRRHEIPTAAAELVRDPADLSAALRRFSQPPVVKADGLAAGKGVTVASSFAEAEQAARACLERDRFGAAGRQVVLEQRLTGQEVSLFAITDGTRFALLAPAQDHKRLGDGDAGPNTGGMGAYAPAPVFDSDVRERALASIVAPTLAGLRAEGRPFVGVLFVGLMIDADGLPQVIEYNCRFGDPETQAQMFGLRTPLLGTLVDAAHGQLRDDELVGDPAAVVGMAAAGYPDTPGRGDVIPDLAEVTGLLWCFCSPWLSLPLLGPVM